MRWSGATGAIARCKRVSTGCGRKRRSVPAWPWICGVKPKPKVGNTPSPHSIVHGLDKPGVFTTVSGFLGDMVTVNLAYKPYVEVERRKYRFRLLNGSVSRMYKIALSDGKPFFQIGNDGNLLPQRVTLTEL